MIDGLRSPAAPLDSPETRDRLVRFALRLTGDPDAAEEVAQETLARAVTRGGERDMPWLLRVALNCVRDMARRRRVRRLDRRDPGTLADPRIAEPGSGMDQAEARVRLWRALGLLPEREREALVLRFAEDLSCREIADLHGTTANAVSCLLRRAKDRLRDLLAEGSRP